MPFSLESKLFICAKLNKVFPVISWVVLGPARKPGRIIEKIRIQNIYVPGYSGCNFFYP